MKSPATVTLVEQEEHRSLWYYSWRRLKRNRLAMAGLYTMITLTLLALFAPFLSPFSPEDQIQEYVTMPLGFRGNVISVHSAIDPSKVNLIPVTTYAVEANGDVTYVDVFGRSQRIAHSRLAGEREEDWHRAPLFLLGTDNLGRDEFSRLLYGARVSLTVGLIAESISLFIGIILGALAGYFRGWVDDVIMWVTNVVWSFPAILLVIAISIVLGKGMWQAFIAIGIANWVDTARIVRGQFFSLRETEYVEATKALGFGSLRTIFRHILPNSLGPVIVISTAGIASAIIYEASLSFLGLGVQPPTPSWGKMIDDGRGYIAAGSHWGLTVFPGIALMIAVFATNLLGDGLRDAMDPKMKR